MLQRIKFDGLLYITNRVIARIPSHTIRLWYYRNIMKFEIGKRSHIFMDAWFDCPGGFSMGSNSVINQKCRLDNRGRLRIGNDVSISADVTILTADHDPRSPGWLGRYGEVVIEDFAFIGTRAMILRGVTIGKGAVVAAGAIVTRDVAPYSIVAGIPARVTGTRSQDLNYTAFYDRLFS